MRDLYQPRGGRWHLGPGALTALALVAAAAVWLVEARLPGPDALTMVPEAVADRARAAESKMRDAIALVARAKVQSGVPVEAGWEGWGLIGVELTPLVTTMGSLEAKRLSTKPEWARVLTERLFHAGIREGDVVAASFSGSFPGLNLATVLACDALGAQLMAISSVTASTWGANQAGFTWPEIEARLVGAGVMPRASIAVSLGGTDDMGVELDPEGRELAQDILERSARELGVPALRPDGFGQAVEQRLRAYDQRRGRRPILLYVNVGGAEASMGRSPGVLRLRNGFLPGVPFDFSREQGVMGRMAQRGVPLLQLLNIRDLAIRWRVGS